VSYEKFTAEAVLFLLALFTVQEMAWQASGVWKKPLNITKKNDDSSFPGLKPSSPEANTKIQYEELQQNEIFAMEAIYGEDFINHTEAHGAWKVLCEDIPARFHTKPYISGHMLISSKSFSEIRAILRYTSKSSVG
jgi:hypothetical protein